MRLNIEDIQRAIASSGDISVFARLNQQISGCPPLDFHFPINGEFSLVKPDVLLRVMDAKLADFVKGNVAVENNLPDRYNIRILPMPSRANNLWQYLVKTIDEHKPDIIALNVDPLSLATETQYAFSLTCAAGFSCHARVKNTERQEYILKRQFHPSGLITQSVRVSWLNNIPVVPLGKRPQEPRLTYVPGQGFIDLTYHETVYWENQILEAEAELETSLIRHGEDSPDKHEAISRNLMKGASESQREKLLEESCYFASRLMDYLTFENSRGRCPDILVLSDLAHYQDIKYICRLLEEKITDEIWREAEPQPDYDKLLLDDTNQAYQIASEAERGISYILFKPHFSEFTEKHLNESIQEETAIGLAARISGRTRFHPGIMRGVSVRGTLAMIEVLRGLALMRGCLDRKMVSRAAEITLGPRLQFEGQFNGTGILEDILKEETFGFTFEPDMSQVLFAAVKKLSSGNILGKIDKLGQLPPEGDIISRPGSNPAIIPQSASDKNTYTRLEKLGLLKKGSDGKYQLTHKAVQTMLDELEHELKSGEIGAEEYQRRKTALQKMMKSMVQPRFKMSSKELAETIMELMDAHDSQWNKEINFQSLRTYYHIKENSEGSRISEYKRDYLSLQKLVEDLEKRNILASVSESSGLLLTGLTMDILLKALRIDFPPRRDAGFSQESGQAESFERSIETRRFSSGDRFRDIAIRPTLREIARQKRNLQNIRRSDLRVFLRQRRQPQKDIMLCIDTSGSMGFHQKLLYARLVAAGIIKSALREKNRVGLIAFNDADQIALPLTTENEDRFMHIVAGLQARGNTNIGEAIKRSRRMLIENLSRNQKHIVLISDGQPTAISEKAYALLQGRSEKDLTEEYAITETRQAARQGIRLSIIHIAGDGESNEQFVRELANSGGGILKRIKGPHDLRYLIT